MFRLVRLLGRQSVFGRMTTIKFMAALAGHRMRLVRFGIHRPVSTTNAAFLQVLTYEEDLRKRLAFGVIKQALIQGRHLHPKLLDPRVNHIRKAMTIAWQNMPFQAGGWFEYTDEQRANGYQTMLEGQGDRFFMAGDAMGYNSGWMEGAIEAGLMAKDRVKEAVEALASQI